MAISAVDNALWDLKARLLEVSLSTCSARRGRARRSTAAAASRRTRWSSSQEQLGGWAEEGFTAVKMKIGREPALDLARVRAAREAIGPEVQLFVDANGAYSRKQALAQAEAFAELDVAWFEEPVSSDDLEGLRLLRDRAPAGMKIAAGEYGYDPVYFRRMLAAGAVDVLQADATRCAGITGFLRAGGAVRGVRAAVFVSLRAGAARRGGLRGAGAFGSASISSTITASSGCSSTALPRARARARWCRIARAPGSGLEFKRADAARYAV